MFNSDYRIPGKFTLTLEERIKLDQILNQKNEDYQNMNNWQVAAMYWNRLLPENLSLIDEDIYKNPNNKPNYSAKNIYFVDNGFFGRIYDDGSYKNRK